MGERARKIAHVRVIDCFPPSKPDIAYRHRNLCRGFRVVSKKQRRTFLELLLGVDGLLLILLFLFFLLLFLCLLLLSLGLLLGLLLGVLLLL